MWGQFFLRRENRSLSLAPHVLLSCPTATCAASWRSTAAPTRSGRAEPQAVWQALQVLQTLLPSRQDVSKGLGSSISANCSAPSNGGLISCINSHRHSDASFLFPSILNRNCRLVLQLRRLRQIEGLPARMQLLAHCAIWRCHFRIRSMARVESFCLLCFSSFSVVR